MSVEEMAGYCDILIHSGSAFAEMLYQSSTADIYYPKPMRLPSPVRTITNLPQSFQLRLAIAKQDFRPGALPSRFMVLQCEENAAR